MTKINKTKKIYTTGKIVAMFLTVLMICFSCPVSAEWFDQDFHITTYNWAMEENAQGIDGNPLSPTYGQYVGCVTANGVSGTFRIDFLTNNFVQLNKNAICFLVKK